MSHSFMNNSFSCFLNVCKNPFFEAKMKLKGHDKNYKGGKRLSY